MSDSLIHVTRIYSNDIRMSLGLEKHSLRVTKRGKQVRTEEIILPEGNIADNENSSWESHTNGNHEEAGRNAATTKYLQRVRHVLRS